MSHFLANFKKYSNRYINDYNISSSNIESTSYNDYDNTKILDDSSSYHKSKDDENFEFLYPDPEEIKNRMTEHHEDSVIKICE